VTAWSGRGSGRKRRTGRGGGGREVTLQTESGLVVWSGRLVVQTLSVSEMAENGSRPPTAALRSGLAQR